MSPRSDERHERWVDRNQTVKRRRYPGAVRGVREHVYNLRMEPEQLLWNQYQQLTDEIKSADTLNYQALGIVIAASVAIVNAAFTRSSPEERFILLLTVFAVTIPGGFLLQVARRRIWRITTYLEIFIEPSLRPIKWQTRLTSILAAKPTATNVIKT